MATDAEVKLNFTVRIEQARAAIKELSSAMQELTASKGQHAAGPGGLAERDAGAVGGVQGAAG